jgi:hypothetical protein
MLLLGAVGKSSILDMLAPHQCRADQLSIDVKGRVNRDLAFVRGGKITHLFVTVVKASLPA